jgi:GMP synthase (glutamine-hydrolysing)
MTADFFRMPFTALDALAGKLLGLDGICAVYYDVTNKPPATIEWE